MGGDKDGAAVEVAGSMGDTARGSEVTAPSYLPENGPGCQRHQQNGSRQPALPGCIMRPVDWQKQELASYRPKGEMFMKIHPM